MTTAASDIDLAHHGDADARPGLVDLAVNVRAGAPPDWLRRRIAEVDVSRYPDASAATAAIAARHRRPTDEVLVTAGATEAFTLVARAFTPSRAVVVHPQFTEPELALRAAGNRVERVLLAPPFRLTESDVDPGADLVVVGNPTNPTSVLHPAATLRALARTGRVLVVDEAFADCVPGEPESLAAVRDIPGLLVVRSLTKTFGLAGLRIGYVLGPAEVIAALANVQPHWSVSAPALEAAVACSSSEAVGDATVWANRMSTDRAFLIDRLTAISGVEVVEAASASFVLIRTPVPAVWDGLVARGFAVRRGDTFPGLGPHWIRVAVRNPSISAALADALEECL